ncbi:pentatricopeptide repeat (PPR) superfamily protein [Artemisia annua]|uniref:Pentatricopeptide repeat (PPR) superfamily protein n=1 Tax=Artemisia annua TaxID=35608 RepID=A0A2U1LC05_ARTAN|nr:pentatricopeptide repeat (PPR) superfamily protein [Artemisia annua]
MYVNDIDNVQYLMQQMKIDGVKCSEDLFINLISCYRRLGLGEQALKTFYRLRDFGCEPSVAIYNCVLDCLLSENRFSMISPVYANMKRDGMEPDKWTYNILLKALSRNGRVDGARKVLDEMSKRGCVPDEVSYTTVVSELCGSGRVKEAKEAVEGDFGRFGMVSVWNALVLGVCKEGEFNEAFRVMEKMVGEGVRLNVITFTTVMNCLADVGEVGIALAVLAKMLLRGCSPNVFTFTSLIKGFCLKGKMEQAYEVYDKMTREGVST